MFIHAGNTGRNIGRTAHLNAQLQQMQIQQS